jgi:hypothetical protein
MLNQESHAVEAARTAGGILSALGWIQNQDNSVDSIRFGGEGFNALLPNTVFKNTSA